MKLEIRKKNRSEVLTLRLRSPALQARVEPRAIDLGRSGVAELVHEVRRVWKGDVRDGVSSAVLQENYYFF